MSNRKETRLAHCRSRYTYVNQCQLIGRHMSFFTCQRLFVYSGVMSDSHRDAEENSQCIVVFFFFLSQRLVAIDLFLFL